MNSVIRLDRLSVWRLELVGAGGQLESMAAGNIFMVPLIDDQAQAQSDLSFAQKAG
jgi:hypothetical protein